MSHASDSSSVYAAQSEHDDVVATICKIVNDDTPQPMRGMKKANKVTTAAEQFSAEHHGEYEARERQSSDKVAAVHRHNQACPKMYDELDKRRSTARVVAVTMSRKDAAKLSAPDRKKGKGENTASKQDRRRGAPKKNPKSRTIKNRLTKRKKQTRRVMPSHKLHRLSKIPKTATYQCHTGNSEFKNSNEDNDEDGKSWGSRGSHVSRSNFSSSNKGRPSSEPSVSSYHTFPSMEHEPMVS